MQSTMDCDLEKKREKYKGTVKSFIAKYVFHGWCIWFKLRPHEREYKRIMKNIHIQWRKLVKKFGE